MYLWTMSGIALCILKKRLLNTYGCHTVCAWLSTLQLALFWGSLPRWLCDRYKQGDLFGFPGAVLIHSTKLGMIISSATLQCHLYVPQGVVLDAEASTVWVSHNLIQFQLFPGLRFS